MPLLSIADLNGPAEEVIRQIERVKHLSVMYDELVNTDNEEPRWEFDGRRERKPGIHPSDFSCTRKVIYSLRNTPMRRGANKFWKQRFKSGHLYHMMFQADCARMAQCSPSLKTAQRLSCLVEFRKEVEVSPARQPLAAKLRIEGSADGEFTLFERDADRKGAAAARCGLEIKTASPDEYKKLTEPKEEHLIQAHFYMACLDLPLMWFFYFSKGTMNNTVSEAPWLIVFDPNLWQKLEARCVEILALADRGELGERCEGEFCNFCPWLYTCQPVCISERLSGSSPIRR